MRKINITEVYETVKDLCVRANIVLRPDVEKALNKAHKHETNAKAKEILSILLENARLARTDEVAVCQDTGLPVVILEVGQDVMFTGGDLSRAIINGVQDGYEEGYFRRSIVCDSVCRKSMPSLTPPVIHYELVKGSRVKISVSPKGFGSENKSAIAMLNPTDGVKRIKQFVIDTVKKAGPNACPPFVIGVGIGGTFEMAALMAKKALLKPIGQHNKARGMAKLEKELLKEINALNIGPMGLGGKTSCLWVGIIDHPTHIAGLPVAVNISCHATRSAEKTI